MQFISLGAAAAGAANPADFQLRLDRYLRLLADLKAERAAPSPLGKR